MRDVGIRLAEPYPPVPLIWNSPDRLNQGPQVAGGLVIKWATPRMGDSPTSNGNIASPRSQVQPRSGAQAHFFDGPGRYDEGVAAEPVMTAEELIERVRDAAPPTADDVPITFDGRRLDSPEAVKKWLADLAARRGAGADGGE
jgi:hypothetical protein